MIDFILPRLKLLNKKVNKDGETTGYDYISLK